MSTYELLSDGVGTAHTTGFVQQLRVLFWKNFLLKRRDLFTTALEVIVPLIVTIALVAIKAQLDVIDNPAKIYNDGKIGVDYSTLLQLGGYLELSSTIIAVYPDDPLSTTFVSDLQTNFPTFQADSIVTFADEDAFNSYCSHPLYGMEAEYPMVQAGIGFVSGSPNWSTRSVSTVPPRFLRLRYCRCPTPSSLQLQT
jgi:hypothetical protein